MINPSLDLFAATLIEAGRIRSGDVKRLQRDLLPDGISSRAEAELLLRLDQTVRDEGDQRWHPEPIRQSNLSTASACWSLIMIQRPAREWVRLWSEQDLG